MKLYHLLLVFCIGMICSMITIQGLDGDVVKRIVCLRAKLSPALPFKRIKDYSEQSIPIKAVLFTTKNRTICANPKQEWVKKAVKFLNRKAKVEKVKSQ